jgi:hypothetical protein
MHESGCRFGIIGVRLLQLQLLHRLSKSRWRRSGSVRVLQLWWHLCIRRSGERVPLPRGKAVAPDDATKAMKE